MSFKAEVALLWINAVAVLLRLALAVLFAYADFSSMIDLPVFGLNSSGILKSYFVALEALTAV